MKKLTLLAAFGLLAIFPLVSAHADEHAEVAAPAVTEEVAPDAENVVTEEVAPDAEHAVTEEVAPDAEHAVTEEKEAPVTE
jgi:hypothetical protein